MRLWDGAHAAASKCVLTGLDNQYKSMWNHNFGVWITNIRLSKWHYYITMKKSHFSSVRPASKVKVIQLLHGNMSQHMAAQPVHSHLHSQMMLGKKWLCFIQIVLVGGSFGWCRSQISARETWWTFPIRVIVFEKIQWEADAVIAQPPPPDTNHLVLLESAEVFVHSCCKLTAFSHHMRSPLMRWVPLRRTPASCCVFSSAPSYQLH